MAVPVCKVEGTSSGEEAETNFFIVSKTFSKETFKQERDAILKYAEEFLIFLNVFQNYNMCQKSRELNCHL